MTESEFIAIIAPFAVADMHQSHIAASLTIAQAALESRWGRSKLTMKANNLFQYDAMKEEEGMSADDKQKLASLEAQLKELQMLVSSLGTSRDTLKTGVLDTSSGGSYDFYRTNKMLYRAGLFAPKEEV